MTKEQIDKKLYTEEKTKHAYELYKQNKLFKKARALIIQNDKLIVLKGKSKNFYTVGGGVEFNERTRDAVKREVLEETNMIVDVKDMIARSYYNVKMSYNGEDFISNRVEFFYICEYVKDGDNSHMGLAGEFDEKTKIEAIDFEEIEKVSCIKKCKLKFKEYILKKLIKN